MSYWPQLLTTPQVQISILPLLGIALVECLVAIWAATSGRHWFLRAVCVWLAIAMLVPVEAWEPAWLFVPSSLLIVLILSWLRWVKQSPRVAAASDGDSKHGEPFHFRLSDLFLLLLLVGMWLPILVAMGRHYRPSNIAGWLISSASVAVIAVLCQVVVVGQRRFWATALLVCAVPAAAAATWAAGDWMHVWYLAGVYPLTMADGVVGLTIVGLELALFLIAILALSPTRLPPEHFMGWRIARVSLLAVILLVPAIPTTMMYWALIQRVPRADKFVTPTVNQYPRIVAIAAELQRLNPKELSTADLKAAAPKSTAPQQVEGLYAELLPLLQAPNAAGYDPDRDAIMAYSPPLQLLRSLARNMKAEGESIRIAGRADRAADFADANIRLGTMLRRGGTAVEALVGNAVESVGHGQLAELRADLSPERSRAAIVSLQRSLAEHEDFASLYARELDYVRRAYGWQDRLDDASALLLGNRTHWSFGLQEAFARGNATNLLLQADLAIRLYQHKTGRLPGELQQLVPDYLPAVPVDPHSGQPLKYRPGQPEFVLYSVGFDGYDDGGSFDSPTTYNNARHRNEPGLDFDLNTLP